MVTILSPKAEQGSDGILLPYISVPWLHTLGTYTVMEHVVSANATPEETEFLGKLIQFRAGLK